MTTEFFPHSTLPSVNTACLWGNKSAARVEERSTTGVVHTSASEYVWAHGHMVPYTCTTQTHVLWCVNPCHTSLHVPHMYYLVMQSHCHRSQLWFTPSLLFNHVHYLSISISFQVRLSLSVVHSNNSNQSHGSTRKRAYRINNLSFPSCSLIIFNSLFFSKW